MKYMIAWKIAPGHYKPAIENFLESGAPVPPGIQSLGRWHALGSSYGWHLVEGDAVAVAEHAAEWSNVAELEIIPVIEDAQAAEAASKAFGK